MGDQEDPKGKQKVLEYQEYQSTPATRAMAMELSSGWDGNTSAASAGAPGASRIPGPTPENPEQDAPRAANQPHGLLTGMGQQAGGSSFHQVVDLHDLPCPHPLDACACWNRDAQGAQQFGGFLILTTPSTPLLFVLASVELWLLSRFVPGNVMARRILHDSPMGQQRGEASEGRPAVQNLPPQPPLPVASSGAVDDKGHPTGQLPGNALGVGGSASRPGVDRHGLQARASGFSQSGDPVVDATFENLGELGHPGLQPPPQAHPVLPDDQPGPAPDLDLDPDPDNEIGWCWGCDLRPAEMLSQPRPHVCACEFCRLVVCEVCYPHQQPPLRQHGAGVPQLQDQTPGTHDNDPPRGISGRMARTGTEACARGDGIGNRSANTAGTLPVREIGEVAAQAGVHDLQRHQAPGLSKKARTATGPSASPSSTARTLPVRGKAGRKVAAHAAVAGHDLPLTSGRREPLVLNNTAAGSAASSVIHPAATRQQPAAPPCRQPGRPSRLSGQPVGGVTRGGIPAASPGAGGEEASARN